jgi:signal peptidase I
VTAPEDREAESTTTVGAAEAGPVSGKRRTKKQGRLARRFGSTTASAIEWAVVIGGAVLLAVIVKVFLVQAFYIPSDSMLPTLRKDDRVLVNKLSYRFGDPDRGDIIVFDRPEGAVASDISELIKRVVGLPGEEIVIEGGDVYVDGRQLEEGYLPEGTVTSTEASDYKCHRDDPCVVPEDHLWVMGDNRGDSQDSRYFGPIPEDTVVGRAFVVVWPLSRFDML